MALEERLVDGHVLDATALASGTMSPPRSIIRNG
jgi:hypothetical protein